jgi:hypothetical protein
MEGKASRASMATVLFPHPTFQKLLRDICRPHHQDVHRLIVCSMIRLTSGRRNIPPYIYEVMDPSF